MTMKSEIKACLILNLEAILDPYMVTQGFTRSKPSLIYKRQFKGAVQIIDIALQIHPKDRPDSSAAIYPQMEVLVPTVDQVLDDIVGDNLGLLEGVTGGRTKQPIGFTSAKQHDGRWFVFQPDSVLPVVADIRAFIERWTLPFLEGYANAEDIIAANERDDARIARDRAQLMRVVAAAVVLDRSSDAQDLMEKWFGAPGLRRRYKQVFDYIKI